MQTGRIRKALNQEENQAAKRQKFAEKCEAQAIYGYGMGSENPMLWNQWSDAVYQIIFGENPELLDELLATNDTTGINDLDILGWTALATAVKYGEEKVAERLRDAGARMTPAQDETPEVGAPEPDSTPIYKSTSKNNGGAIVPFGIYKGNWLLGPQELRDDVQRELEKLPAESAATTKPSNKKS